MSVLPRILGACGYLLSSLFYGIAQIAIKKVHGVMNVFLVPLRSHLSEFQIHQSPRNSVMYSHHLPFVSERSYATEPLCLMLPHFRDLVCRAPCFLRMIEKGRRTMISLGSLGQGTSVGSVVIPLEWVEAFVRDGWK